MFDFALIHLSVRNAKFRIIRLVNGSICVEGTFTVQQLRFLRKCDARANAWLHASDDSDVMVGDEEDALEPPKPILDAVDDSRSSTVDGISSSSDDASDAEEPKAAPEPVVPAAPVLDVFTTKSWAMPSLNTRTFSVKRFGLRSQIQ